MSSAIKGKWYFQGRMSKERSRRGTSIGYPVIIASRMFLIWFTFTSKFNLFLCKKNSLGLYIINISLFSLLLQEICYRMPRTSENPNAKMSFRASGRECSGEERFYRAVSQRLSSSNREDEPTHLCQSKEAGDGMYDKSEILDILWQLGHLEVPGSAQNKKHQNLIGIG